MTFLPSRGFPKGRAALAVRAGRGKGGHRGDEAPPDFNGWMGQCWRRSCSLLQVPQGDADVPKVMDKSGLESVICLNLFILEAAPQPCPPDIAGSLPAPGTEPSVSCPHLSLALGTGTAPPALPGAAGPRRILRAPEPGAGQERRAAERTEPGLCPLSHPVPPGGLPVPGRGFPWALQEPHSRWDRGMVWVGRGFKHHLAPGWKSSCAGRGRGGCSSSRGWFFGGSRLGEPIPWHCWER